MEDIYLQGCLVADCTFIGAGNDEAIVWGTAKGNCQAVLRGHDASMRWAELIGNGRELLTASADGMIKRWDLQTGICKQTSPGTSPELVRKHVVAKSLRRSACRADTLPLGQGACWYLLNRYIGV